MAKRYNFLTRCLAAIALLFMYVVGTSAILVGATSPAQAWRGRGFYGGRGGFYGRGYGYGYYAPRAYYVAPRAYYGPRCYFSYRWNRTICRY